MDYDNRTPLKKGTEISMNNNAIYTIEELIGRGGLSLVYLAKTQGGATPIVIKEFFPAPDSTGHTYAMRNNLGQVCPSDTDPLDYNRFQKAKELFESEGIIGGDIAAHTSQTVSFWEYNNSYAVMKKNSADMYSISALVSAWKKTSPLPITGNIKDVDPVWTDLPRVRYALAVIESLLSALSVVHKRNYLHLDLSGSNVFWSCQDPRTGRGGFAVISDYGNAATMVNDAFQPTYRMLSSTGFAAPEIFDEECTCTRGTDLFSVSMLLVFLCVGEEKFEWFVSKRGAGTEHWKKRIAREIGTIDLNIPKDIMDQLQVILTAGIIHRSYANTEEMQLAVIKLHDIITSSYFHPINPDATKEFTLYSLKSMLEGSLGTRSGWAEELRYRRKAYHVQIPEESHVPISRTHFSDNESFLRSILPKEAYAFLMEMINETSNPPKYIHNILSCNYPVDWRDKICYYFRKVGFRKLIQKSECLLNNPQVFALQYKLLFDLLQDDGKVLNKCFQSCHVREYPHIGLALLILYALIGNNSVVGNKTKAFDEFIYELGNPHKHFN